MSHRIVVVGSINVDLVTRVERIPAPGETVLGSDLEQLPGGKGANQAVAAARLGSNVSLVACVGDDAFGQSALDNLAKNNVDTSCVRRHPTAATGTALITVDTMGENAIAVASGANLRLQAEDVRRAQGLIEKAEILLLQLEVPLEAVIEAVTIARAAGTRVVLNPAPARELPAALLEGVDILTPNAHEAQLIFGGANDEHTPRHFAGHLVTTRGAQGVTIVDASGDALRIPAHGVDVVDTTGAGDAFNGALAHRLAAGDPISEAARYAVAAAALAVTSAGAQTALPKEAAVAALLARTAGATAATN